MPTDLQPDDDASAGPEPSAQDRESAAGGKEEPPAAPSNDDGVPPWSRRWRSWVLPLGLLIAVAVTFAMNGSKSTPLIDCTTFYRALDGGEVKAVVLRGDELEGELSKPRTVEGKAVTHFQTQLPTRDDPALLPLLRAKGVVVRVEAPSGWIQLLAGFVPWLLTLPGRIRSGFVQDR